MELLQALAQQVIRDPDGIRDNRQRRIHGARRNKAGRIHNEKIVEIVSFAVLVKNAVGGILTHTACAVLVADTFDRNALLKICMKRHMGCRVPGSLENIDPAILEAIERFHIVRCVGELNAMPSRIGDGLRLVRPASIAGRVRPDHTRLHRLYRQRCRVVKRHAILGVGQVFGGEPPWNGMMLHRLENETWSERRCITLHHLEVKAADRLHLSEGVRIVRVVALQVEVIRAPCLRVRVLVALCRERQQGICLVVHEVTAHLIGSIRQTGRVFVIYGREQDHRRVDGTRAQCEQAARVRGSMTLFRCRRRIGLAWIGCAAIGLASPGVNHLNCRDCRAAEFVSRRVTREFVISVTLGRCMICRMQLMSASDFA